MRALLVDDDSSTRAVILRILSRQFELMEIVECQDGVEAIELLSREAFSLVLLDLVMPLIDGFDVLESMRRTPALSAIPVIMMSGVNEERVIRRILDVGVTDYILKPVRPAQLCERVSRILLRASGDSSDVRPALARAPFVPLDLTPTTPVLLADGDSDFREFFRKSLQQLCRVRTVSSGLEAFQACLEEPPHVLFVGSDLDIVKGDILVRKLRDHPRLCGTRMIGIEPPRTLIAVRKRGVYEAVMQRSFVQDVLLECLQSLQCRSGQRTGLVNLVPDLRLMAIGALEEVLNATFKSPATLKPPRTGALPSAVATSAVLTLGREGLELLVRLETPTKNVSRLVEKMVGAPGGSESEERKLAALLTQMLAAIATDLRCRNVPADWGAIAISRLPTRKAEAVTEPAPDIMIHFEVAGERLVLSINSEVASDKKSGSRIPRVAA